MKKAIVLLVLMASSLLIYCQDKAVEFKDQEAVVKMVIKSRGVYQFLIQVENEGGSLLLMPGELEEEFKKDGLKIIISGKLQEKWTQIYKAGPTDKPEPDYKVQNLKIESIKRKMS